jgi:GTP-binding protein HflX
MNIKARDKAILVGCGLKTDSFMDLKESLCELEDLARAAGAEVVGSLVQNVTSLNPATLIGSGKLDELNEMTKELEPKVVIFDHHLSGVQTRNLEATLNVRVLDRSQLILDIFAMRAQTYEGKLQVELAQMLDQMPRMVNAWMGSLSRLGGGVGTRGPGETALEMDRRRIRDRVKTIRKRLDSVRNHRSQHRAARKKNKIPSFALIGYTNSGKSTLLNVLTKSNVLALDQVFATLDPTTRKLHLPNGQQSVVTDTVGFIRKLPPELIEAFKATLEETAEADVLLHVVDLSSPHMQMQMDTVEALMKEFNWTHKPIITVFNKVDVAPFSRQFHIQAHPRVFISAHTGEGIERLKGLMTEFAERMGEEVQLYFPRAEEHRIYDLGRETQILKKESASSGTVCYAQMTPTLLTRWKEFLVTVEV